MGESHKNTFFKQKERKNKKERKLIGTSKNLHLSYSEARTPLSNRNVP